MHASQFWPPLSISRHRQRRRALCLRRYLLRTVFSGENIFTSRPCVRHGRGVLPLRGRRCRRVASLTCESLCPFGRPFFGGPSKRDHQNTRLCRSCSRFIYPSIFARINVHVSYYARRPVRTRRTLIAIRGNVIPPLPPTLIGSLVRSRARRAIATLTRGASRD